MDLSTKALISFAITVILILIFAVLFFHFGLSAVFMIALPLIIVAFIADKIRNNKDE